MSTFEVISRAVRTRRSRATKNLCKPTKTVTRTEVITKKVGRRRVKIHRKVSLKVAGELVLPTTIGAQNGSVVEEVLPLKVSHCSVVKSAKAKKKPAGRKRARSTNKVR